MKLDDIRSIGDPLFSYRFEVEFPSEIILKSEYVITIDVPAPSTGTNDVLHYGSKEYIADTKATSSFTIRFYEDQNGTTLSGLEQWRTLVVDEDNNYGYPTNYKKDITVGLLNNENKRFMTVVLEGCFPTMRSPLSMSGDTGSNVTITQEFSCDNVKYYVNGSQTSLIEDSPYSGFGSSFLSSLGSKIPKGIVPTGDGSSIMDKLPDMSKYVNISGDFVNGKFKVNSNFNLPSVPNLGLPKLPNLPGPFGGIITKTVNSTGSNVSNSARRILNQKVNKAKRKVNSKLPKF